MTAPLPLDEEARLAVLGSLDILDTLPEADYDDLVRVAGVLMDVPVALVSMVDRERQWFKAKAGLEVCETSRDLAFCAHAILEAEPLVVNDATLDPRFADNSLVTGPLGVRFYAGAPIVVDGHALGTLCCIDTVPRKPSARQIDALAALARQAGALLRSRAEARRFAQGERRFAAFFDNAPATVFLKDEAGRMRYVNGRFETMFDRPAAEVIGRTDYEWLPKEFADACALDDEATRNVGARQVEERVPIAEDRFQVWQTHKFAIDMEEGRWVGGIAIDITALREAEETVRSQNDELIVREQELTLALQETETSRMAARLAAMRFEQLFAGLPVACFTYSIGGTIHEWNAAAESLWGIQAEDALLESVHHTVVGTENRARQEEVDARVFAGEIVSGVERRETMRDGRVRWLLTSTFPLRSTSGTIVGAVCANIDVTERKLAEKELREAKWFAESMADNATSMLYLVDYETKTQLWSNRDLSETLGYSLSELHASGEDLLPKIVHPDDLARMLSLSNDFLHIGDREVIEFEARFRHADGEWRWLWHRETIYKRNTDGSPSQIMGSAQDVTERKRMEAELRANEARFRTVVDSLHEGVVVQDAAGGVSLWNRSAERIIGIKGEQFDLRSENDPRARALREDGTPVPIEERPAALAIRDGLPHEAIIGTKTATGETRWHSLMAVPLPSEDGGPARSAVVSFLDVTERKRMESEIRANEARFRTVVESLQEGLTVQDAEGKILLWNPSAQRIMGADITGANALDGYGTEWRLIQEDGTEFSMDQTPVKRAIQTGETQVGAILGVKTADGVRWLSVNASPLAREGQGAVTEAVSSFVDITERMRMEKALRESEARFRTVVESLAEGLVVHNESQEVVYCNRSAERILGISGDQLRGQTQLPKEFRIVNEDGTESRFDDRPVAHALRSGEPQEPRTLGVHRSDGEFRWISVGAVPVASGVESRNREAVASFLDITQRIEHERQIREYSAGLEAANVRLENLATTDGLTGLKNHRFFQDWLRRRIEHCIGSRMPLSIALLDVDRFKMYNDDFGHQAGDAVLRGVATALESSVRSGDLVARYGGEEFVIVMPGADETEALVVADRVRQTISKLPFPDRIVTASFGIATWEPALSDAPAMIRAADEALYQSKDDGRNRVTHWRSIVPALNVA